MYRYFVQSRKITIKKYIQAKYTPPPRQTKKLIHAYNFDQKNEKRFILRKILGGFNLFLGTISKLFLDFPPIRYFRIFSKILEILCRIRNSRRTAIQMRYIDWGLQQ